MILSGVFRRQDHSFYTAAAKAARNNNAVKTREQTSGTRLRDLFRIDPADIHMYMMVISRVMKRFRHRQIGVMQPDILSDKPDLHRMGIRPVDLPDHPFPFCKIRCRSIDPQLPAHHL